MARYTKVLKSLAHNAVGDRRIQAAAPAGTNFYTTGATLGGNNILTGSTQTTTWTADLSALAGGGGTIGGSITDNQIAVGASTANSIEGSAQFKYDGSKILLGDNTDTGNYLLVEGSDSENTYTVFEGKRRYPRIRLTDTSSNKTQDIWVLGSQMRFGSNGSTAGNAAMVIQSGNTGDVFFNGNVGIGTSGPQQPLHVLTSANDKGILIDVSDDTHEGRLLFGDTSSNAIGYVGYNHSLDAMRFFTNGSESLRLESDQDAVFYGNIIATGATAHVIVGQYTRLQRNINTNGLHLTDSGGNAVAYTTLSGATGGFWLDNTTSNRIYRGAGVSYWDSTESYRLQGNTTSGYMQLDMNKIMLVRSASSAASNVLQIGDGSTYDQFSIVEDQRGSSATNGYVKLRAKKTGNDGYRKISLGAISGSTTSELLIDSISTNEALRFDTNSKSHAFDIAKAGYVSVGGAVDNTNQFTVLGTSLLSGNTVVEGNITGSSNVLLGSNLVHYGDTDTYIGFTGDDIEIFAGGESFIKMTEATTDSSLVFNDGSEDIDIRMESDANDSMFFLDSGLSRIGIGTSSVNEILTVQGVVSLDETSAPSATSGYGKIYVKSSDSKLYFMNDSGTETDLTAGGGGTIGGSITDNQVAFGASTSNSIEGSADLTYDGYKLTIGRTAGNEPRGVRILDDEGTETISLITSSSDQGLLYLRGPTGGNAIYLDGNGASYMNGGYIGFGTTSPDNQAEVTIVGKVYQQVDANGNINYGSGSFAHGSGIGNYTGYYSSIIGAQAGYYISGAAHRNTAVGYRAMFGDSTGIEGTDNTGIGAYALQNIKDGTYNVAVGGGAGLSITDGTSNTFIGLNAGKFNTTSNYSTAIGAEAMGTLDGAGNSTAIGYLSMYAHNGDNNVAVGNYSLRTGSNAYNVAVGVSAMTKVSGGAGGVAVGYQSGYHPTGNYNVFMGYNAGFGTAGAAANLNVGVGYNALLNVNGAVANTAVGDGAGQSLSDGDYNTFIGRRAGYQATTGDYNTLIGVNAGTSQSTHTGNTFVGYNAGASVTEQYITALGYQALGAGTGANYDVAIGFQAHYNGTGRGVFIGLQAGAATTGGGVHIGSEAGETSTTAGQVLIGQEAGKAVSGTATALTAVGHGASTNASGTYHTMLGYQAGTNLKGNVNVGIGYRTLRSGTNATHQNNVAIGYQTMQGGNYSVTNQDNVAIGVNTMRYASGSSYNVAVGQTLFAQDQTSTQVVSIGYRALSGTTSTTGTTAIGHLAARDLTVGDFNTVIGKSAMVQNTQGEENTMVGYDAGYSVASAGALQGSFNTFIGFRAAYSYVGGVDYGSNVAIGHQTLMTGTNANRTVALGNSAGVSGTASLDNVLVGYGAGSYANSTGNTMIGNKAGFRPSGNYNVAVGYQALSGASAGSSAQLNVAMGYQSAISITSGYSNTSIGYQTSYSMTTGAGNTHIGNQAGFSGSTHNNTTFIGNAAGLKNTSNDNVAIGAEAYLSGSSATQIVAIGRHAGKGITTGQGIIAIGPNAVQENDSGTHNIGIGWQALMGATGVSHRNIGIGTSALLDVTTGDDNVGVGYQAINNVTTGEYNVAVGTNALNDLTTTSNNVAIGFNAGHETTTADNVWVGYQAGYHSESSGSVAVGKQAGYYPHGNNNTFLGFKAGMGDSSTTTGHNNVAVGRESLTAVSSGEKNTTIGARAGASLTSQGGAVFAGFEAGLNQAAGSGRSVAIGHQALYNGTQNYEDVAIGFNAGYKATGASASNVFLGSRAGPSSTGVIQNKLYIHNAEGTPLIGGDFAAAEIYLNGDVGIGTTAPDRKLDVQSTSTAVVVSGTGGGTYGVMRVVDTADTTALEVVGQRSDGEGALMRLKHESTSPDVGDYVGTISFEGNDDGGARSPYAYIRGRIRDKSAGAEDGSLYFQVVENNARTDVMTLSGTKVGIGTTSPAELFNVESASNTLALFKSTDNRGLIQVADDDTTASIVAENSTLSLGLTSQISASNINIDSSGKLGIGTTSPSYPLHVAQGTATYGIYMPNSNSRGIRFGDTSNNGTGYGRIEGIGGSLFLGSSQVYTSLIGTGDASTTLGSQNRRWSYFFTRFGQVGYDTSTTTTAQFGISGASDKVPLEVYAYNKTTPAIHVTSGNRVGINTTSPAHGFTVFNTDFYLNSGDMHISQNKYFKNANDGGQSHGFPSSGKYVFNNVNVGIGTSAPTAKLHVDGDIRIDSGHTLDFQTKAYIDVNLLDGTGDDKLILRRRGNTNEVVFDMSTASAPIIDSPNGTLDFQAASTPVAQFKDDTGIIMQDMQGIKNHVATLANFPIDAGTGIATANIQGFSKIQNISLAAYAGGGLPTNLDIKLPVGAAGMEFIVTLGDTALNLGSLTLRLVANGSDIIYNAANAVSNISYTKNVGESIHLICFEANKWSVVAHT